MSLPTVGDLVDEVQRRVEEVGTVSKASKEAALSNSRHAPEYRINMFATHLWKRAPCDWLFEYTDPEHPMTLADIKKALGLLVDR